MRFNQLASELAFHRSRVSRGIHSRNHDPQAQEAAYLHALQALVDELQRALVEPLIRFSPRWCLVSGLYLAPAAQGYFHQSRKLVRIQLLPSTFDANGCATLEQRLTCFLIDDCVAVDAGSIAIALTNEQRSKVRDIIVTHPHMDHIASLPIFIDDLYPTLNEPMRVHATPEVIGLLERDVFNWNVYPRFSDLKNDYGPVMEYVPIPVGEPFPVAHLTVTAVPVNHIVPTVGLIVSDGKKSVAFSSDTAETEEFWKLVNQAQASRCVTDRSVVSEPNGQTR